LKISKGSSEDVNQRTDNTMVKENGQTTIYRTQNKDLKTDQHEYTINRR